MVRPKKRAFRAKTAIGLSGIELAVFRKGERLSKVPLLQKWTITRRVTLNDSFSSAVAFENTFVKYALPRSSQ
jgi:hypothetical protein